MNKPETTYIIIGIVTFIAIAVVLFYVGKAQGRAKSGTK
jgi:hypothetical protein